jgi:16S rRNA (cytosine1402-N4)-methyltransferase
MAACRITTMNDIHQPVLFNEVIENLVIKADGYYVDATFGRGGHAKAILDRLSPRGKLLAFDKDPQAIAYAQTYFSNDSRFSLFHGSFAQINHFLSQQDLIGKIDGFFFDLGVSSPQFDDPDRGFSFMRGGKLDMRMDTTQGMDAAEWLATVSEKELMEVLWKYGEERFARRIVRDILAVRSEKPITTTTQLAEIIAGAVPVYTKGRHPATKSFQAIRIAVNHELDDLEKGLDQAYQALKITGRLLVISFHSLEDRIVKHFIQDKELGERLPSKLPIKQQDSMPGLRKLGRAIKPNAQEIANNPRARSAILRIAEKLS